MRQATGEVEEIWYEYGEIAGRIRLPAGLAPGPGQYLLAAVPADAEAALAVALFPAHVERGSLHVAPPLPPTWVPGTQLDLRGPFGNGFRLPPGARRLALAALDGSPARLFPLIELALEQDRAVTLYWDAPEGDGILSAWPAALEIYPLEALPEALAWADSLALDVSAGLLPELRRRLGLLPDGRLACPTQVLVRTAMPCAGAAECGVCAVRARHGWLLACKDGPVFDLNDLEW